MGTVTLLYAVGDLNEWTRGVLFPLAVLFVAGTFGWIARCLTNIMREFRHTREEVREIRRALQRLGILETLDD
jgi:hypothetical protein